MERARCTHIMVRGKNEGQPCPNPAKVGSVYCSKHQKEPAAPAVRVADEPRVVIEDEPRVQRVVVVESPAVETRVERSVVVEDEPMPDVASLSIQADQPVDRKRPRSPSPVRAAPPIEPAAAVESDAKKLKKTRKVVEKPCTFRESQFEASTVMTVEEAKRLDFRIKQREYNLAHRTYNTFESERCCGYLVIKGTPIVLNESQTEIMGYLHNQQFVRAPNRATDRAVIEYGLPFNADDIEVDE